jgi:hypothetical protein
VWLPAEWHTRSIVADASSRYRITPIQHPTDGAAFERQPLSRIALTPPLILQLDTWDKDDRLIIP